MYVIFFLQTNNIKVRPKTQEVSYRSVANTQIMNTLADIDYMHTRGRASAFALGTQTDAKF